MFPNCVAEMADDLMNGIPENRNRIRQTENFPVFVKLEMARQHHCIFPGDDLRDHCGITAGVNFLFYRIRRGTRFLPVIP